MQLLARHGLRAVRRATPLLLLVAFVLLLLVLLPGFGVTVNGARRWLGAGPLQFQPAEIMKLALVLHAAAVLSARPRLARSLRGVARPILLPGRRRDGADRRAARPRDRARDRLHAGRDARRGRAAAAPARARRRRGRRSRSRSSRCVEPYRRARLTAFLSPWDHAGTIGFQSVQGQIAIGSGGLFGLGPGQSVQKIFYLPEAHTDFILAVIGEELGLAGICGLLALYGMIGYAGLRTAKAATRRVRQAARRRPHLADPVPGAAQHLHRARARAADRRAAAVHLLGLDLADRAAGGDGPAAQRRQRRLRRTCAPSGRRGSRPMSAPRIVIAAGGTAGHVVPALAVADALRAEGAEVAFVGGERAEAELVPAAGYPLDSDPRRGHLAHEPARGAARGRQGRSSRVGAARAHPAPARRRRGARRRRLRRRARWASPPCSARVPLVLTEADSHLGLTNRLLAPRARARLPRLPARRAATAAATSSPGARSRRAWPTARGARAALGHRARGARACSSSAARSARARSTRRRSPPSPTRPTASSTSPAGATSPTLAAPGPHYDLRDYLTPFGQALAAADLAVARAGGIDLRARPVRPAGRARPLPARDRRPPDRATRAG